MAELTREQLIRKRDLLAKKLELENKLKSQGGVRKQQPSGDPMYNRYGSKGVVEGAKQFGSDAAQTGLGYLEGATFGIPRAIVEKGAGEAVKHFAPDDKELYDKVTNLPRGNQVGQLVGGLGAGMALEKLISKAVPGLMGKGLLARAGRGALVGGTVSNTPLVTDPDASGAERGVKTVAGAGLGAGAEAVLPPVLGTISKLFQGKTSLQRGIRKLLNPPKTYEQNFESRVGQIKQGAKQTSETVDREIGTRIAPEGEDLYKQRLKAMEPDALVEAGLTQDEIDDVIAYKKRVGATSAPTVDEANQAYGEVMDKVPDDFKLNISSTTKHLEKLLKANDMLDAQGRVNPGIGRDNSVLTGLLDTYQTLKSRIAMNKKIPRLLNQTEQDILKVSGPGHSKEALKHGVMHDTLNLTPEAKSGIEEALRNPDEITKAAYERAKGNLQGLLTGNKSLDRHVMQTLEKLQTDAEAAGIEGLAEAHHMRRVASVLDPAHKIIGSPKGQYGKTIQSSMKRVMDPNNASDREMLLRKLGKEGVSMVDEQARNLALSEEEASRALGKLENSKNNRLRLLAKKQGKEKLLKRGLYAAGGAEGLHLTYKGGKSALRSLARKNQ